MKAKKATTARMHQRVRDRLPQLPVLIDTAERLPDDHAALLTDALNTPAGDLFVHRARRWRLVAAPRTRARAEEGPRSAAPVVIENADTGERVDAARGEDDAF